MKFAYSLLLLLASSVNNQIFAQLQSEVRPADKLIEEYLLTADEISTNYCVRSSGTMSVASKKGTVPAVADYIGIAARSAKLDCAFHASGFQSMVSPSTFGHRWQEVLRIGQNHYDKNSVGETPTYPPRPDDRKDESRVRPFFPFIDPLGLVLCTEGALQADRSKITNLQEQFLKHQFRESSLTKNGDVLGVWIINRSAAVSVLFGREAGYMPVETKYYSYDADSDGIGACTSTTTTKWTRYAGELLVPSTIEMHETRPGGEEKVENKFDFEWLPLAIWEKEPIDFKSLLTYERSVWRERFMALFDE